MKKYVSVLAAVALLFSCGKETSDPSGDNQPQGGGGDKPAGELTVTCTTGAATEIDPTSAKLSGTATIANAKEANGKACFYYSATQGDAQALKSASKADADNVAATGGSFTVTISGLSPETTYYYVAAVTIDSKETFGEVKSFTTAELPKGPTTTGAATNITEWSAVLSAYANPTADMGTVTMGIIYSTDENPTLDNGVQLTSKELDGNNMYTIKATQLASNTTYYYKSTLESAGVIRSGEIKSFKTKEIYATVTTEEATDINCAYATVRGRLNLNSTEPLDVKVCISYARKEYYEENGKMYKTIEVELNDDGSFSYELYFMSPTYYYVASATVYDKECVGEMCEVTVLDLGSVETKEASEITNDSALLNGRITFNTNTYAYCDFIYSDTATTLEELIESGKHTWSDWTYSEDGEYDYFISNLKSATKYYYVALANIANSCDWSTDRYHKFYGEVKTFETLQAVPATSVSLSTVALQMFPGEKSRLTAFVKPDDTTDKVTWKSSNTNVATVVDGVVTANNTGEAIISAMAGDQKAECKVTVSTTVDLGLSVKWAAFNLGANKAEEYGRYFAWGEISTKSVYSWSTYKYGSSSSSLTKYNTDPNYGSVDNKTSFKDYNYNDDAARAVLGGSWRIPTKAEWTELTTKCTSRWTSDYNGTGVGGMVVTSNVNGRCIFLPAAGERDDNLDDAGRCGCYWSSSLDPEIPFRAWSGFFQSSYGYAIDCLASTRCRGLSIRPVTD